MSLADKMIPEESQSESDMSRTHRKQENLNLLQKKIMNHNFSDVLAAAKAL
jgi:hypothetical protein